MIRPVYNRSISSITHKSGADTGGAEGAGAPRKICKREGKKRGKERKKRGKERKKRGKERKKRGKGRKRGRKRKRERPNECPNA